MSEVLSTEKALLISNILVGSSCFIGFICFVASHYIANSIVNGSLFIANILCTLYIVLLAVGSQNLLWSLYVLLVVDRFLRLLLSLYWILCIIICILISNLRVIKQSLVLTQRKLFHFLAIIMFIPPLLYSRLDSFMILAFSVALTILIYVEVLRCYVLPQATQLNSLSRYYNRFLNDRYMIYSELAIDVLYECNIVIA